ncbi:hypothetical protein K7N18_04875 [Burkholderia arboris]|uniref:hypothetical protein n=1 Tax=Burkholderia arboris TaxID=488730 RepID=UPI001CA3FC42|nr:hypothetical protein [Burkholderia arboris]MBY8604161.1 hypothetical protein [Burkholderia arboris]
MDLLDHDVASVSIFLSSERLATFNAITGSIKEAILLHQQMLQLGTTLMTVTAVIEISCRNSISEQLSTLLGSGWLRNPPASFAWKDSERSKIVQAEGSARKALYSKKSQADKKALDALAYPGGVPAGISHDTLSKARQKTITVSDGQVIAQLTMFFWKRLFSSDYEVSLWNRSLKRIFPDKALKRADIATHMEDIYQARNRIAHHEPIYDKRLDRVLDAVEFVIRNLGKADSTGKTTLGKLLGAEMKQLSDEARALRETLARFRGAPAGAPPAGP